LFSFVFLDRKQSTTSYTDSTTAILLRPLLDANALQQLHVGEFFHVSLLLYLFYNLFVILKRAAIRVWLRLNDEYGACHSTASRLLLTLHTRAVDKLVLNDDGCAQQTHVEKLILQQLTGDVMVWN
jgi:hypothetical protein